MSRKFRSIIPVLAALTMGFISQPSMGINSNQIRTQTDSSGKITVAVFERVAGSAQQHFHDFAIDVPSGFVAIGGGAEGTNRPQGNLITASYPNHDYSSWLVSSKDHSHANPVKLKGYAIGLKVDGLTREQLLRHIVVNVASSGVVQHPDIAVGIPPGYVLIGGGLKVNWAGSGNLATATYPETSYNWRAKSKDHTHASPANTQVFAIALREHIDGVGILDVDINSSTSGTAQHPASSANVAAGYALVGCGAHVHWRGAGNLLWKIKPLTQGSQHGCEVASKDHSHASPATITSYAIGLRLR